MNLSHPAIGGGNKRRNPSEHPPSLLPKKISKPSKKVLRAAIFFCKKFFSCPLCSYQQPPVAIFLNSSRLKISSQTYLGHTVGRSTCSRPPPRIPAPSSPAVPVGRSTCRRPPPCIPAPTSPAVHLPPPPQRFPQFLRAPAFLRPVH